jgi:hypothetical protein
VFVLLWCTASEYLKLVFRHTFFISNEDILHRMYARCIVFCLFLRFVLLDVLKYSLKCTTDEQFYDFAFIIVYLMKFSSFLSFLCCPIMCLYVLSSVLGCPLPFLHRNDVRFVFAYSCLLQGSCVIYVSCACLGIIVLLPTVNIFRF